MTMQFQFRFQPLNAPGAARAGGVPGFLRTLCALALVAAPVLALEDPSGGGGGTTRNAPPSNGSGGQVAGDETVGTLPIQGPPEPFDLLRYLRDERASVSLEGSRIDLLSAIVNIEGRTMATVEILDA